MIRHHRLRASDVIAHAVLEAPAAAYRQARDGARPWRYSAYLFLVFLLTKDGVRHVTATVNTLNGDVRDRRRMNYRFDAIASVGVIDTGTTGQTFELTLANGRPTTVAVTADDTDGTGITEESQGLGEVTLLPHLRPVTRRPAQFCRPACCQAAHRAQEREAAHSLA